VLLLDNEQPFANKKGWQLWLPKEQKQLPQSWPDTMGKTPPADGSDYELIAGTAFDPVEQRIMLQMRPLMAGGQPEVDDLHTHFNNTRNELRQMLELLV
jgi:hypothetical protein